VDLTRKSIVFSLTNG